MTLDHLLLPMPPTPNGSLHVGHVGGPYLRADALARALRRDGRTVFVASGTDGFENWVLKAAVAEGTTPEEVCRRNHAAITDDLAFMDIGLDLWIDPVLGEDRVAYTARHEEIFECLRATGAARRAPEPVPTSSVSGQVLFGGWIGGSCPACGAVVAGNSCVACGAGFQPSEIVDPRSHLDGQEIAWIEQESWFVEPPADAVQEALSVVGAEPLRDVARAHLARSGTRVRLTTPGEWGITSDALAPGTTLTNTFYEYCVHLADESARRVDGPDAPGHLSSEGPPLVHAFFGLDNAGIAFVAPAVISVASGGRLRMFDRVHVNHMLHLEGRKCSASKGHGIWVGELRASGEVSSSELRYVLSAVPLDHALSSLDVRTVTREINDLRRWVASRLEPAVADAGPALDAAGRAAVEDVVAEQRRHLGVDRVDLAGASSVLRAWMGRPATDAAGERAWLHGLALLAWPVMPALAHEVWRDLGLDGAPSMAVTDPDIGWSGPNPSPTTCVGREPLDEARVRGFARIAD